MRIQRNKNCTADAFLRGCLTGLIIGLAVIFATVKVNGATYEEVMASDFSGYNRNDVVRILNEDMSQPTKLASNQRRACLISPMRAYSEDFYKVADGIKYEALVAISAMETGHFKSAVATYHNNVGGMRGADGYMSFNSKEDGIDALADLLIEDYLDTSGYYFAGTTIVDVGQHYNQSVHWVNMYVKVRLDMERRIEGVEPIRAKAKRPKTCRHKVIRPKQLQGFDAFKQLNIKIL